MNIIYLLTNKSKRKKGQPKYYIGSKTECRIERIHKRDVIVDLKTNRIYWGSSSNLQMKQDLKTDKFEASILAKVGGRQNCSVCLYRTRYHFY